MFSVVFLFQFIIVMVNYCVCGGCTNSGLSGHRVHRFPNKKRHGAIFRAWVRFVQVKRQDFIISSVSKNSVVCMVHFRQEDYRPDDMMEFNMGCKSKNQVRLRAGAVPSVHTAHSSSPPSLPSGSSATAGRHDGHQWRNFPCAPMFILSILNSM